MALLLPKRKSKILLLRSGERFTDNKIVRGVKVRGMACPGLYEDSTPALSEGLRQLRAALDAFQYNSDFESEGPSRRLARRIVQTLAIANLETVR